MAKCWYCGINELTGEHVSSEHIIPDALGGRLKSETLLCRTCNSSFGDSVDIILIDDLQYFTHLINPIRDKRRLNDRRFTAFEADGKSYLVRKGNKPHHVLTMDIDGREVQWSFNTREEMIAYGNKKVREMEASGRRCQLVTYKPETPKSLVFSNRDKSFTFSELKILKPLAKIAVNYYMYCGGDIRYVSDMIEFLKRENRGIPNTYGRFYYCPIPLYEEQENEISHNLYILGDPNQRTLIAFVEVLSLYSALFVLSLNYKGPLIEKSYSYDLVKGVTLDRKLSLERERIFYQTLNNQPRRQERNQMRQKLDRLHSVIGNELNKEIFRNRN